MPETIINPVQTDCTQYVPSLVVPNQTIMVQHLFAPRRPLSDLDLHALQRTNFAPDQTWLYQLQGPSGLMEMVQLTMIRPPTMQPAVCLASPACSVPSQMAQSTPVVAPPSLPEGYEQMKPYDGAYAHSEDGEVVYDP